MNSILAKIGKVPAHLLSTQEDSDFEFWRYADLRDRRIVTDRADLLRKQARGFPRAVKFSKGQGAVALFPRKEVIAWIRANMISAGKTDQ